ncbi:hypothetical protein CLV24_11731 [Pontibacter ummariensis]|uniref:Lipoprotein n=1 Tax=Pontibacter ummariensis TaxID=1610492 RepID=A0A239IGK2_9BACT|nr:hypothetical protein [Pontibacter ummariensis]PRY09827.1 hypothetical protein CLV24_11731 [Pontibacter ummariensis]SNS92378.1 hypothetical protein SAMN06296052_11731 [Pontibacter ummariensis]
MRNILILIPMIVLLLSCNEQEGEEVTVDNVSLYSADIKQMAGTKASTNFSAKLVDLSGHEVTDQSQIKANSIYLIRVESGSPAYFRIKFADGFTVIDAPKGNQSGDEPGPPSTTATFTIKTNEDAASGVYVNIVPIHKDGNAVIRERSKNFLFPETR